MTPRFHSSELLSAEKLHDAGQSMSLLILSLIVHLGWTPI